MKLKLKIQGFTLLILPFLFFSFSTIAQIKTQKDAIKLAEKFIKENGYTKYPADTSNLSYDLFDILEKGKKQIIAKRYNTLYSKAFCISRDQDRWNIGFLSTQINIQSKDSVKMGKAFGRAVVMKDNGEIWIAHKDPIFSTFSKL